MNLIAVLFSIMWGFIVNIFSKCTFFSVKSWISFRSVYNAYATKHSSSQKPQQQFPDSMSKEVIYKTFIQFQRIHTAKLSGFDNSA